MDECDKKVRYIQIVYISFSFPLLWYYRKMLRRILLKRVGVHVPIEPHRLAIAKNDFLLKSDCKKITVSIVRPTIDEIQVIKGRLDLVYSIVNLYRTII